MDGWMDGCALMWNWELGIGNWELYYYVIVSLCFYDGLDGSIARQLDSSMGWDGMGMCFWYAMV